MLKLCRLLIIGAALTSPALNAIAQDLDADVLTAFSAFGYTHIKPTPGKPCVVETVLSEDDFIKAIPALQKIGILNPDLTQTAINTKPHMIESAFTLQTAPVATRDLFEKNEKIITCQFRQMLTDTDDYGADRKRLMFSYKFDRATNNRVKWDNLKTANFPKIAPEFKFELWFMQAINGEAGQ